MNPTARRIASVRAREWRELGSRSRTAARSLANDSARLVEEHPAASVAAAAMIGLTALMLLRRRPDPMPCMASESASAAPARPARERSAHGIFSEVFSKAVGAWLLSICTPREPVQTRGPKSR